MVAPSKTKKIESLAKLLQKRFKGLPAPPQREVLGHLIFAALLENATYETAGSAFAVLENHFIDWNEVRVSTVSELADTFSMLPAPQAAGERVRKTLQRVFEKTYMYDLEDLRKKSKNLGQAVEFLESLGACSRFMIQYATQSAFGGHVIPLDEASMRIFRLLGLAQVSKDRTREEVPGLERGIAKKNGLPFSVQLHHFGACYYSDPDSEELRSILKSIDPEAVKREWVPPVLVIPKPAPAPVEPVVPTPPVAAPLPFVASEDDDFDEERDGTEAEFISDDQDFGSEPVVTVKPPLPREKKVPQEAAATKKTARKKEAVATVKKDDPPVQKQDKAFGKAKPDKKKTTAEKDHPVKEKKATEPPPLKKAAPKTTGKTKPAKKTEKPEAKKKDASPAVKKTSSSGKQAPSKETKSPTRQLREKKPK